MKKVVLIVLSFVSLGAMAQTFTVDDTLSAGDSQLYWTADSNAVNYDGVTGAGVTWDYSMLQGYTDASNEDTVINASDSPDFGDFPNADYNDNMNGGASLFFKNYPDSVISYGYVFSIDGNLVKIMHNVDPMKTLEFPMNLNDTFTDSTYGVADVYGNTGDTEGDVVVIADGTGTLNLGSSVFSNVIRTKLVETLTTTITLPPPYNTVDGIVTRTVYRYYDLANQNEAILIHGTIDVSSILFNGGYSAVYSAVQLPFADVGIENEEVGTFEIYPNPAQDIVVISSDKADNIVIMNTLGQVISNINNPQAKEKIDLSEFETGVYFVQINKGDASKTKKLIVQ